MIQTKRVYEAPAKSDGQRFLVDRLWPRGVKKDTLSLAGWCKDAAPSNELRRWFNHDPAKWSQFQHHYQADLATRPQAIQPLLEAARDGNLTLLYSARDPQHNNAVALKAYLEEQLAAGTV